MPPPPKPPVPPHEQPSLVKRAEYLRSLGRTAAILSEFRSVRGITEARGDVTSMTARAHVNALLKMPGVRVETERVWEDRRGPSTIRYRITKVPKGAFVVPGVTERLPRAPWEPVA